MTDIKSKINQPFRYTLMTFYIRCLIIEFSYSAFVYNLHIIGVVSAEKVENNIEYEKCIDGLVGIVGLGLQISAVESKQVWRQNTRDHYEPRIT
jgi:hypothetical protein